MQTVRPAAVAGLFYPEDPRELRATVDGCLAATAAPAEEPPAKAFVVPHAGFVYSGPVAAAAYRRLAPLRGRIRRVVLLGPSHRVAFRGLGATSADVFETPLGRVAIDRAGVERALALPQVRLLDAAHAREHSLEVQLPFLQVVLGDDFALVPLVVGDATPEEVSAVIEALWGGDETLVLVSSDLSHYLPYDDARRLDRTTCDAIERLEPRAIGRDQACGRLPVQGLLLAAKRHGLAARTLDLRSSGDTAGTRDAVVGYGAWAFGAPREGALRESDERLLSVARASIDRGLAEGKPAIVDPLAFAQPLRDWGASFVTLRRNGALRGCTGSLEAFRPLVVDVAANAFSSAFHDPRFRPLTSDERAGLDVHLSILGPCVPLEAGSEDELLAALRPGVDGLVIQEGARRATFLPAVWEQLPDRREFLAHLRRKAGLPAEAWSPAQRFSRYEVREVGG